MSSELNVDVEILKLARLIDCDASGLDYLRGVEAQEIRDLREQVTVTMFEADCQMLQRVATAARLIPTKLAALIGERAFGPLLCARLTGLLEPSRAVDVAAKLPTPFLTDLAVQLDPRRASRVIAEIPPTQIADITRVLAEREEYIAMGGFVGHLSEAALRAAIAVVGDEVLLRTAYVIESKGSIAALVATLSDTRLESIVATATRADLWIEALDVLGHVSEEQRGQLGDIAARQDDEVLDGMVRTAQRELLWDDVLPVTRAMSPESRERFAALKSIHTRPGSPRSSTRRRATDCGPSCCSYCRCCPPPPVAGSPRWAPGSDVRSSRRSSAPRTPVGCGVRCWTSRPSSRSAPRC